MQSLTRREVVVTFIGVMLAMFLASLDQTVVGTAMPRIIADLGGFSHYTWVTTAYIITSAVTVPITGKLTDMYGRKYFYVAGLGIFILASFLNGISSTMTQLIVFRGLQGMGAGVIMANAFTVIGDLFPPAERGKYQGMMTGVFGLSSIIGPALGGYITHNYSWNWIFFVNIPLGLIIIALFILFFPHLRPDHHKHSVDYPGVALLVLTVVPIMLGLSWAGVQFPWLSPPILGLFLFSAVIGLLFILVESRAREPIIPLSLFKNRIVAVSEMVIFLSSCGMFATIIFIPLFFQGVLGVSAVTSGNLMIPMMLGVVAGSAISGQVLSRAGGHYRIQGAIGLAISGLGLAMLSGMNAGTTLFQATVNLVVTGFGLGVIMPLYTIAVQNAVPYHQLGVATSSAAFFRSLGGSVGLAVFGSAMNNRFAAEFLSRIPPVIKAAVPPERLASLAHNPQALLNPAARAQLDSLLMQTGPQGAALSEQLLQSLRQALAVAVSQVFLIGILVLGAAFVVNLFIKEIPLRRRRIVVTPPGNEKNAG
ncbi:MAG: MDR family MFS transporter [Dehalococcoidia bacterium]|nr:MDR family MFS transporter [Dehalococcoidia bacterium]